MPHDLMTRCEQKKGVQGHERRLLEMGGSDCFRVAGVPREKIRCMYCVLSWRRAAT
jgi:hypothetical protein